MFRASNRFSDLGQIVDVESNQIREDAWRFIWTAAPNWRSSINRALRVDSPFFRVASSKEGVSDVLSFAPHLDAPASRFQFCVCRHCVCTRFQFRVRYVCTARSNAVQACAILASFECTRSAHVPVLVLW